MKKRPFHSPLIMRKNAKQPVYGIFIFALFLCFTAWIIKTALSPFSAVTFTEGALLSVLTAWLVISVKKYHQSDVTVCLTPILCICADKVLFRTVSFLLDLKNGISFAAVVLVLLEICFWIAFAVSAVWAVTGKWKIIIPMLFLFFAFFYTFIQYDLHAFPYIGRQICLLLLLWFPLDAIDVESMIDTERNP